MTTDKEAKIIAEEISKMVKEINNRPKNIKLACKHDWGNTSFCKICLSVNNCLVK